MKYDVNEIKRIPILEVLHYFGFETRTTGKWASVKGDTSLKVDVASNTYHDFSNKYGHGTVIDFVMHTQNVDFVRACEILGGCFLGSVPMDGWHPKSVAKSNQSSIKSSMKRYLSEQVVGALLGEKHYTINALYQFMQRWGVTPAMMQKLNIGTTKDGHAAFLYQNSEGQYEAVKVVPYNAHTGKRSGDIIVPKGFQSKDGYTAKCFYNEIAVNQAEVVFIVESEKTAAIGTLYFKNPNFAFIATGGAQKLANLLRSKAGLLSEKKVVLLPDNDAAGSDWITVATQFRSLYECLQVWILDADAPDKSDLADLIILQTLGWEVTFNSLYKKLQGGARVGALPEQPSRVPIENSRVGALPEQPSRAQPPRALMPIKQRDDELKSFFAKQGVDWEELKAFFAKQVLPETLQYYNSKGVVYATITNLPAYVANLLELVEDLTNNKQYRHAQVYVYHLLRVKESLKEGSYIQSEQLDDEVPF
ncbi:MAG: DUF6371 domain-containing protein [Bacteroidia bacterium]|nr:DUF6371 domain-containing protein [Bacteroidia bacterium]